MGEWLVSLVPWGADVIVWVQSFSNDWLDAISRFLTFLGNEEFYLLLLPFIFWCVHKGIGVRLGYLSLISVWINYVIKYLFKIARPAEWDTRIRPLVEETSPSFPSGHAQNAVANWGYLAYRIRRPVFWVIAAMVILGIGLSRIVLGVHFPQDMIAGWLIGVVVLAAFVWVEPPVTRWLKEQKRPIQLILAVGVPVLLIFVHPADVEGLYPPAGSITPMSALAGFGAGLIMEQAWVRFRVDGEWWRRGLRFLVGLVVVAVFYLGPRLILPEGMAYGLEALLRFIRYALVGWATAFLCPWLFVVLRLAEKEGA